MSDETMNWNEYKEGLLDGLEENSTRRNVTSQVLENYAKKEAKILNEAGEISTDAMSRYDQIFMPLMRRVTPELMSMDLVGTQPLNGPTGLVRTMRFRYGRDVETTSGSGVNEVTDGDEASAQNIYQKYSLIASGDAYDAVDAMTNHEQTLNLEGDRGNPMKLDVTNYTVTAGSRKLSAEWTLEYEDDSSRLDGVSIQTEISATVAEQIRVDIDREILGELNNLAGTVSNYDMVNADGRYAGEKFSALTIGLSELSNQIAVKSRRSGATWMVVTPQVLTAIRNADNNSFVGAGVDVSPSQSMFVGTFNNTIRVYLDIHASTEYALLGYKGSETDTGLIYAPYVPIVASDVVTDTDTFNKVMSLRTRYGMAKFVDVDSNLNNSPDFYARSTISNLQLGFVSS